MANTEIKSNNSITTPETLEKTVCSPADQQKRVAKYYHTVSGVPRVALYTRSTLPETMSAQRENLEHYAKVHGFIIVGTYSDAGDASIENPGLSEMFKSVERGEVDLLLTSGGVDRFVRSKDEYEQLLEILEAHNCNLEIVKLKKE